MIDAFEKLKNVKLTPEQEEQFLKESEKRRQRDIKKYEEYDKHQRKFDMNREYNI